MNYDELLFENEWLHRSLHHRHIENVPVRIYKGAKPIRHTIRNELLHRIVNNQNLTKDLYYYLATRLITDIPKPVDTNELNPLYKWLRTHTIALDGYLTPIFIENLLYVNQYNDDDIEFISTFLNATRHIMSYDSLWWYTTQKTYHQPVILWTKMEPRTTYQFLTQPENEICNFNEVANIISYEMAPFIHHIKAHIHIQHTDSTDDILYKTRVKNAVRKCLLKIANGLKHVNDSNDTKNIINKSHKNHGDYRRLLNYLVDTCIVPPK